MLTKMLRTFAKRYVQAPSGDRLNMKVMNYIFTLACIFGLLSCVEMHQTFRKQVSSEFPLWSGCRWTYNHFDAITKILDTVSVFIESEKPLNDGSYEYVWTFKSRTKTVSYPVILSGRSIQSLPAPFGPKVVTRLNFPLAGMRLLRSSVIVSAGSFPKCFLIKRSPHIPNAYGLFCYWISPGIGIVKISEKMFDTIVFEQIDETWELISYAIEETVPAHNKQNNDAG